MTYTKSLAANVRDKFKSPMVVAALLDLEPTPNNLSHIGGVLRGERTAPLQWVGRFAEILDMNPADAIEQATAEREALDRAKYKGDQIAEALKAYPIAKSLALKAARAP